LFDRLGIERQDHDRSATDPTQLEKSGVLVGPLVHGHRRHCRVKGIVTERQMFGHCVNGRAIRATLRSHHGRRLYGGDHQVVGLVGARPGADIHERSRVAEGLPYQSGDCGIGTTSKCVAGAPSLVIEIAR